MKLKLVALFVSCFLLAAVPASAADRLYIAEANATALQLTITEPGGEPQGLTFGSTGALVQSDAGGSCPATACATAAAAVEPFGERAVAVAKTGAKEDSAEGFTLPEGLEQILTGSLGVATVRAEPAPSPQSDATATAGLLEVTLAQSIADQIGDDLDGAVEQVADGLEPILTPIQEGESTDLTEEVEQLLRGLADSLQANPLAVVEVGASDAAASDNEKAALTKASATAEGVVVQVAPVEAVAPQGLFRVEVGAATASVESDGTKIKKSSEGSVARVFVADITTAKADDYQEVNVATDQPEQCFGQSPLVLCIIVGGTADNSEDGGAAVTAAAVRIKAFADADEPDADNPLPGLTLAVAEANAALNVEQTAVAVVGDPAPEPEPEPEEEPRNLPSTGGGLAGLGFAVLGAGVLATRSLRRR